MCEVSGFYILTVSVHQDELLPKTLLSTQLKSKPLQWNHVVKKKSPSTRLLTL